MSGENHDAAVRAALAAVLEAVDDVLYDRDPKRSMCEAVEQFKAALSARAEADRGEEDDQ